MADINDADAQRTSKYKVVRVRSDFTLNAETLISEIMHHGFAFLRVSKSMRKVLQNVQQSRDRFFSLKRKQKNKFLSTFGDTGYCERPNLKEQLQIRLGKGKCCFGLIVSVSLTSLTSMIRC